MSEAFLGEIRIFAGLRVPANWMACNGQSLSISEYEALFSLIGTQYGGDGINNFALPNLQGRLVVGTGQGVGLQNYALGQTAGAYQVGLTDATASHTHGLAASTASASATAPANGVFAATPSGFVAYIPSTAAGINKAQFDPNLLTTEGGNGAHENMMPSTAVQYIICMAGIYPQFN